MTVKICDVSNKPVFLPALSVHIIKTGDLARNAL